MNDEGEVYYTHGLALEKDPLEILHTDIYTTAIKAIGAINVVKISASEWFGESSQYIKNDEYYLFYRKLINQQSSVDLGVLMFAIPANLLDEKISAISSHSDINSIIITDTSQQVIYSTLPVSETLLSNVSNINYGISQIISLDKKEYTIRKNKTDTINWSIFVLTPIKDLYKNINKAMLLIIIPLCFAFLGLIIFVILFSRSITNPIYNIVSFAKKVEDGAMDSRLPQYRLIEFNALSHSLNTMTEKLENTIQQNYLLGIKTREAEVKSLRAQINPHFVFNTLNSINAYATLHDVPEISNMTHALSDIMRYSIKSHMHMVSVSEELLTIKNYLYIQNIRFNNQMKIVTNISPDTFKCKTPPFLLQPIVENAIHHGLELSPGARTLVILGKIKNDTLVFVVSDNGRGIAKKKLAEINSLLQPSNAYIKNKSNNLSIGILNVHQRIQYRFGDKYGLSVKSQLGVGTEFTITLPVIYEDYSE